MKEKLHIKKKKFTQTNCTVRALPQIAERIIIGQRPLISSTSAIMMNMIFHTLNTYFHILNSFTQLQTEKKYLSFLLMHIFGTFFQISVNFRKVVCSCSFSVNGTSWMEPR